MRTNRELRLDAGSDRISRPITVPAGAAALRVHCGDRARFALEPREVKSALQEWDSIGRSDADCYHVWIPDDAVSED